MHVPDEPATLQRSQAPPHSVSQHTLSVHCPLMQGPSALHGDEVESPDIRAGMTLLIAALCAEGQSTIRNIRQIDRGYERIEEKLRRLGARIERVSISP